MRAVRHRAVAEEAGVALGSTTYHFKSLDDLIASTFVYWMEQDNRNRGAKLSSIEDIIQSFSANNQTPSPEALFTVACDYLHTQVVDNRDDRFIELAFHNEAIRNQQLSELILGSWQADAEQLAGFYAAMGSKTPELDGEDTHALILQLERRSLLFTEEQLTKEFEKMKKILTRHVEKVLMQLQH